VVNDATLDREVAALLAVEPSPEFLARVRTRVAEEPEPAGWRLAWMFGAAATVATVVVALIVWPSPDATSSLVVTPSRRAPVEPARVAEAGPVIATAPVTSSPQPARRPLAVNVAAALVASDRAIDIDFPEVMLGENEVRAYTALIASIRQRRFDVAVPAAPDPNRTLAIEETPPVEPLEIEPIVKVAALQPEGERP
jgi:hypothetical protein